MKTINLKDYYPYYNQDIFLEIPDDLAEVFEEYQKKERAYQRKKYRHKAHYSLDREDGIEHNILVRSLSPDEIYEHRIMNQQLHAAIVSLPDKQAKRIYAHYFMGMSKADIAKVEGVSKATIGESIDRALQRIEKYLKTHD